MAGALPEGPDCDRRFRQTATVGPERSTGIDDVAGRTR